MLIGWRRGASKLPLTYDENGARGTWLEKRLALIKLLREQHEVIPLSDPTPNSKAAGFRKIDAEVDLLIIEFAGMNAVFFGEDWAETCRIAQRHTGPILFLTDDPDLTFPWAMLPDEDYSRWTVGVNAIDLDASRQILKVPTAAEIIDLPYASLIPQREYIDGSIDQVIYYGRPNGRAKLIKQFIPHPDIAIAGKPKEWEGFGITPWLPPTQTERAYWYGMWKGCLALYDQKHAQSGWRTGRAYHALKAGIPVLAPPGNVGLDWTTPITNPDQIRQYLDADRSVIHAQQVAQANPTFKLPII